MALVMRADRYTTDDLLALMARLRDPETGCPWDLAQTFATIAPCTLEECYELVAAIEAGDYGHVAEELGDVLFQVVFYAQLGREEGRFEFADVVHGLVEKLVRRHPHVFADGTLNGSPPPQSKSSAEIKATWEAIKAEERAGKTLHGSMADVPANLPALTRAQKIQKRAASFGFDWRYSDAVVDKLDEEVAEFKEALAEGDREAQLEELGDVLFTCTNLARHLDSDAESLLRAATRKFEIRFLAMEKVLQAAGLQIAVASDAERQRAWSEVKAME
ncbi:MAG: ATP diphosphatase [Halieaceae bacterium]|jgi:ATP diphosphatase